MEAHTTSDVLTNERLHELSCPSPGRWLLAVMCDWTIIAAILVACREWPEWPVWLAAILVVGNRQHALGVLMHEGVHYRITSSRRWNELLSDWLAGYPIFIPTDNYRVFHLKHHRWLDTPRDPERHVFENFPTEFRFPMERLRFFLYLLRDLSGLWPRPLFMLVRLVWGLPEQKRWHLIPIALLHAGVIAVALATGTIHFYLLLWLVPMLTVFQATFRVRYITEHHGIDEAGKERYTREEPDVLRTTRSIRGWMGQTLFGPHGINYHLEHHLYPSVPFFNLPELSRTLEQNSSIRERIRDSYRAAIGECVAPRSAPR